MKLPDAKRQRCSSRSMPTPTRSSTNAACRSTRSRRALPTGWPRGWRNGKNRSDIVAGVDLRGAGRSVSSILLDLVRRETRVGAARISSLVVGAARNRVRLLRKPQRSADFAVLRAPDRSVGARRARFPHQSAG